MNAAIGLVVAIIAALALLTAIVFLATHRGDPPKPDPPPSRPHMNGHSRLKRVVSYSPEQLKSLRDPRTGHLIGRGRLMRLYVEARRKVTGRDSRTIKP